MSYEYERKRKRAQQPEGTLILSGDAAQVDYEDTTPVWKQEVTDAQGRKRLHGAFTGGFSAGYFNTVGSAEGWTPASFVSSRTKRYNALDNKALNYMDEEDLEEIEADRQLRLRKEQAAKEEEDGVDMTPRPKSPKQEGALSLPVKLKPRLAAPTGGSKALSLMDDDDEVDGYDIGPKIKYDKDLAKRKKTANGVKHVFQSKKVIKIPQPEPEILRESVSPVLKPAPEPERLLPSIGESNNFINPDRRAQVDASPLPPWRQEPADKLPPWHQAQTEFQPPSLGTTTATAALQSTFSPYPTDPMKHARYRKYLASEADGSKHTKDIDMDDDTWRAELSEFRKAGLMYQPLQGSMSDKFTSSTTPCAATESVQLRAAKAGQYGHLTRVVTDWAPNRLLLKRFNIDLNNPQQSSMHRDREDYKADKKADMKRHKEEVEAMLASRY